MNSVKRQNLSASVALSLLIEKTVAICRSVTRYENRRDIFQKNQFIRSKPVNQQTI